MRVAMDVSPLAQTRAGTARYVRGLLAHLDVERVAFGGTSRAATLARDALWYPSLALKGPRNVGQWSTSAPAGARRRGYQSASAASVRAREVAGYDTCTTSRCSTSAWT